MRARIRSFDLTYHGQFCKERPFDGLQHLHGLGMRCGLRFALRGQLIFFPLARFRFSFVPVPAVLVCSNAQGLLTAFVQVRRHLQFG